MPLCPSAPLPLCPSAPLPLCPLVPRPRLLCPPFPLLYSSVPLPPPAPSSLCFPEYPRGVRSASQAPPPLMLQSAQPASALLFGKSQRETASQKSSDPDVQGERRPPECTQELFDVQMFHVKHSASSVLGKRPLQALSSRKMPRPARRKARRLSSLSPLFPNSLRSGYGPAFLAQSKTAFVRRKKLLVFCEQPDILLF